MVNVSMFMIRQLVRLLEKYKYRSNVRFTQDDALAELNFPLINPRPNSPIQSLKHEICLAYLNRIGKRRLSLRESVEMLTYVRGFWRKISRGHRNKMRLIARLLADIRNPLENRVARRRSASGISNAEVMGNRTLRLMASSLTDGYDDGPVEPDFVVDSDTIYNNDADDEDEIPRRPRRYRRRPY